MESEITASFYYQGYDWWLSCLLKQVLRLLRRHRPQTCNNSQDHSATIVDLSAQTELSGIRTTRDNFLQNLYLLWTYFVKFKSMFRLCFVNGNKRMSIKANVYHLDILTRRAMVRIILHRMSALCLHCAKYFIILSPNPTLPSQIGVITPSCIGGKTKKK